jgi:hypothetical protein
MSTPLLVPEQERYYVVRERIFLPTELERALLVIHEERLTGTLLLDVSQGALNSVRFREEKKVANSP